MKASLGQLLLLLFADVVSSTSDPNPVEWTPNPLDAALQFETSTLTIYHPSYGVRNVSYYVADGNAIIDGDINFGPVDQLLAHSVDAQMLVDEELTSNIYQKRALTHERGRFAWPGAKVSYMFDSGYTEGKLGSTVQEAFRRWKAKAPYFTFTKVPNDPRKKGVITFKSGETGCWAFVGYQGRQAEMTVNLQQSVSGMCGADEATHEIGHALGFWHEHQRADREKTVHFNCAALIPNCPGGQQLPPGRNCCGGPYQNGCCGLISNFNLMQGPGIDNTGSYDIGSTMQYRRDAFALPGQATLVPARAGIEVPSRNIGWPSGTDIARLCKLYPRECRRRKKIVGEYDLEEIDDFYGVGFSKEELEEYLSS